MTYGGSNANAVPSSVAIQKITTKKKIGHKIIIYYTIRNYILSVIFIPCSY